MKLLPPDVIFQNQNAPNSISAGALPQTRPRPRRGTLQCSPGPLVVYIRGLLLSEGRMVRKGREGRGKRRVGEGKGRKGKGGEGIKVRKERGGEGGRGRERVASWQLGDGRPCKSGLSALFVFFLNGERYLLDDKNTQNLSVRAKIETTDHEFS